MILDKLLTFARPEDGAITTSKEICLAQGDLPAPNIGMAPYEGLFLTVSTYTTPVSNLDITLEDAETQAGPFTPLAVYPALTAGAGEVIVKAPIPFKAKNWLRLTFSAASEVNAFITHGVDKGGAVHND